MKHVLMHTALLVSFTVSAVRAADVELVGQPCRAKQILGTLMVTDRHDGRERLVLLNDNETAHCQILYIDFEKDTGEVFTAPAGAGSWTGIEVPGDRLVIGTFYDGCFMVFDLKTKTFAKVAKFPGEEYIWNQVLGADGRVYGGTYPGGKLGALNLDTYTVEDLGNPAAPNQYLRNVSRTPWGQLVANFGMSHSTTKIYDIKSKAWQDVPGLKAEQQFGIGVTWNGYFIVNDPRVSRVQAFKDASLVPLPELPFPVPPGAPFSVNTVLSDEKTLYLLQANAVFRFRADDRDRKLTKMADIRLNGGHYVAVAKDGSLLGLRGQSYFVVKPGDKAIKLRPIPVESTGRPSLFLEGDANGRIWGGPHFGQTVYYYDIKTGKTVNTECVCDSGGEVYDVAFRKGRVYTASYAGGDITEYDPTQPWDQWNHKNPKPVARVSPAFIRPTGGIRTGPDGKLYAGWSAKYGVYGGAISVTDIDAGKTTLIENPLGAQGIQSFDVDRKNVYVGTNLGASGLPNQPGQAKFGMVDLATRKTVFQKSFDSGAVSHVTVEPKTSLVTFTVKSTLYLFDPKTSAVTEKPIADLPKITAGSILPLGDGTLITACGKQIVRIDLAARSFKVIVESPVGPGPIALASDNRLYFTHEADLYRTTAPIR